MNDDTTPGGHGPQFHALVAEVRRLRRDGAANSGAVMAKARLLLAAGKITAADVAFLNAVRIRLDEGLP